MPVEVTAPEPADIPPRNNKVTVIPGDWTIATTGDKVTVIPGDWAIATTGDKVTVNFVEHSYYNNTDEVP